MMPTNHNVTKTLICTAVVLLLSQCSYWEQRKEDQRLDAEYDTYYAAHVPESKSLKELKEAARRAHAARVKKMYASDKADEYFEFTPADLAELKELMESLQELPPVEREAWKAEQRKGVELPLAIPYYMYFTDLEFLDSAGKVIGELSLTCRIASTEKAESYRNKANRAFCPDYMLSPGALKRFESLPPVAKSGY